MLLIRNQIDRRFRSREPVGVERGSRAPWRSESDDDDGNNEAMHLRPNEERGRRVKGSGTEAGIGALHRAAHQQKGGYGADWESKAGSLQYYV